MFARQRSYHLPPRPIAGGITETDDLSRRLASCCTRGDRNKRTLEIANIGNERQRLAPAYEMRKARRDDRRRGCREMNAPTAGRGLNLEGLPEADEGLIGRASTSNREPPSIPAHPSRRVVKR